MSDESEAPTDLNVLMNIDPLDLTRQERDEIIAYQRKTRAQREAGVKVKKVKDTSAPTIDIKALLGTIPRATPAAGSTIRRRL